MQHFDQRPHRGSIDPYLIDSLQGGYYVMCGGWWDVLFVKGMHYSSKMHVYLIYNLLILTTSLKQYFATI